MLSHDNLAWTAKSLAEFLVKTLDKNLIKCSFALFCTHFSAEFLFFAVFIFSSKTVSILSYLSSLNI